MKISVQQIVTAVDSGALAKLEGLTPSWSVRFQCARLTEAVRAEHGRFQRLQHEAVKKYGVRDGDTIKVIHPDNKPENVQAFSEAITALMGTSIDVPHDAISATALGEDCPLTINDVRCLGPLLRE